MSTSEIHDILFETYKYKNYESLLKYLLASHTFVA